VRAYSAANVLLPVVCETDCTLYRTSQGLYIKKGKVFPKEAATDDLLIAMAKKLFKIFAEQSRF